MHRDTKAKACFVLKTLATDIASFHIYITMFRVRARLTHYLNLSALTLRPNSSCQLALVGDSSIWYSGKCLLYICILFLKRYSRAIMITTTLTGLTTIFTPPSTCSSSWTYEAEVFNSVPGGLLLQNALSNYLDTECFPSGFGYAGRAPDTIEVFSPGACPMGYTTAIESFNSGTTLVVCCQKYVYTSSKIHSTS
jgi:hypothetical protein